MTKESLKYSVGIVGLGAVGSATYRELWHVDRIEQIYLFTTDLNKGEARKNELQGKRRIKVKPVVKHYNELEQELDNLDVIIMTAAKPGYLDKGPLATREDALQDNLPILIRTAQMIQGFEGHVIVATNPVDIATYIMCSHSGIPPEYFTGLSHVDFARWRTKLWEVYEPKGLRADLLDQFRIVTVGPHSEKVVPIIVAFGGEKRFKGLPRQEFSSLGDISYEELRQKVRDFWIEQYMLTGEGTEWSTSQAIAEVIEAIYYQDQMDEFEYVCNSVFMNPQHVGVEGALNGQFFGWPHIYKGLMAVPLLYFRVEDDFDLAKVADGWHDLESKILDSHSIKVFPKFVSSSVDIRELAGYKEEEEKKIPRIRYEPFDLETRVVAGCYQEVFTWDDLNNPNQREPKGFDEIKDKNCIHTFCVEDVDGKMFYLIGHDNGFLIINPLTQEVFSIKHSNERSVRSLALEQISNDLYLFAANGDRAVMIDVDKPKKVFREFAGFSGDISRILVENIGDIPYLFVAARGVYQYEIDKPDKQYVYGMEDESDYVIDLKLHGSKLYGCTQDRMLCWNRGLPSSVPWQSGYVPGNGISGFDIAYLWGNDYAFVATVGPQVYRVNLSTGEVEEKDVYQKKPGNKKGTGHVEVARIGDLDCLLASDKNRYWHTRQAGITIWDALRPDMPLAFLTTNLDHSIRGFEVLKKS